MRNSIILNDVPSTLFKGLLIQSLPPISKPEKRVETITVDGRAGDIINELGYAAYDRKITIGLYGDYNLDEIIAYFDSKGTVIFSNEPDKVYEYTIVKQIDFERLIRYRTAEVTFHVQPFKHSSVERALSTSEGTGTLSRLTVTNSGNTIARPTLTINGAGEVTVQVEDNTVTSVFTIDLSKENDIIIDCERMEASWDGVLKNRLVTGNYSKFFLKRGTNTIIVHGDSVRSFAVDNYSRWI